MRLAATLQPPSHKLTVLALLVLVAAGAGVPRRAVAQQTAAGQAEGAEAQGGLIDRVLIRINGRAILYSEFESQFRDWLSSVAGQLPAAEVDAQMPQLRMQFARATVENVALQQYAEELGLTSNPNEIDRLVQRVREDNDLMDDAAWKQALAQQGMTEAALREMFGDRIVQERLMQTLSRQVVASDREARTYYDEHPGDFTTPEKVLFGQLIFIFRGTDRAPVRERAEQALAELRGGASLSAVGAKYAQDGDQVMSADTASWLSPDDLQPVVAKAMAGMAPLTYSDIIEGPFGYYILQLTDRQESVTKPFEEALPEIKALIRQQKMGARVDDFLKDLLKDAYIEVYADEFAELPSLLQAESNGAPARPSR